MSHVLSSMMLLHYAAAWTGSSLEDLSFHKIFKLVSGVQLGSVCYCELMHALCAAVAWTPDS